MIKKLELYLKHIICGQQQGLIATLIKMILLPFSWIYGMIVNCRNHLYEKGWMRRYVPPVPLVISIGNIVAGGTGKTPVTLMLAGAFYERFTIAILSRGYRSKAEKLDTPLLLCEGHGPTFPASYCGDEPYLFAQRLPKSIVIVGGNRKKASFLAAKAGAQAIFLDDGMQHRRLARDFDVVVMDVADPFGQGYFLPRGLLRDDVSSLKRASLIVLNHIYDEEQFSSVKNLLQHYTNAPMIGTTDNVTAIRDLNGQIMNLDSNQKVGMFCAIANPDYFHRTLEQQGFEVVSQYILTDHEMIREKDLEYFAQMSLKKGANYLICTEKDRVKVSEQWTISLPIIWVQINLRIVSGQEEWQNFLQQAELKIK